MKGQSRVREIGRKFFGSWSIEPAFVLFYLGYTIKTGAGIVEQLILDKVSQAYYGRTPQTFQKKSGAVTEAVNDFRHASTPSTTTRPYAPT